MENNNKKLNYTKENYNELKMGEHVMIKKNCSKSGEHLVSRKLNMRNENIIANLMNYYNGSIYSIIVDESLYNFEESEE